MSRLACRAALRERWPGAKAFRHHALMKKPPAKGRGFPFSAEVGCLWEEVALHAEHAAPHSFVGRSVEASRPVAAAAEVEVDLRRIHVLPQLRPHHFHADVEVL